ncbi:hypothetical protein M3649_21125 [Ureibacillus chungkukjangi]|uniref:hypothetical protein n=1 Tax=Ureibacillus chungkukjangi TaxID=1202712 RepID=UPI00204172F0|nr:hypothetical protein [Ureibacillus chungkukjangi]MCM3390589.1 hypothetical protein [Ureibacillus chungkukjangi]
MKDNKPIIVRFTPEIFEQLLLYSKEFGFTTHTQAALFLIRVGMLTYSEVDRALQVPKCITEDRISIKVVVTDKFNEMISEFGKRHSISSRNDTLNWLVALALHQSKGKWGGKND